MLRHPQLPIRMIQIALMMIWKALGRKRKLKRVLMGLPLLKMLEVKDL
jgi:hypothetical protein